MTVRETLAFSARCQGLGTNLEMLAELSRREKEANIRPDPDVDIYMKAACLKGEEVSIVTDYILKILGLDICADTLVGDEMTRGISGGQKKRVTIGEMLVGPAKVHFMDEITTGLDSFTAYQVVNSIRQSTRILKETVLVSLLQPEPETYELFDDIMLISEGKIVYQGPREHVLEFFRSMGFKCPERKGVADFLQEVTSKRDQQQYWAEEEKPYRFITAREFAEAFKGFHVGQRLMAELSISFDKTESHPAALTTKSYGVSRKDILKACASRELLLMRRNYFVYLFKLLQLSFMAIIATTLFLRTKMSRDNLMDGRMFSGAIFFVVNTVMFGGMSEIVMSILKLPVFYRQRNSFFFPVWAYALPQWIFSIPVNVLEIAVITALTYYEIGFDPNFGRFIKYYLLLLTLMQAGHSLFRLIGAIGRNMIIAFLYGYFMLLLVFALSGFVLPRDTINKWWIWGYYISPMMYAENAIMVSPYANVSLGVEVLKFQGFFPSSCCTFLHSHVSNASYVFAAPVKPQAVIIPEDENEVSTEKKGELWLQMLEHNLYNEVYISSLIFDYNLK
ncbi:pleiotropic drug resistance 12 [Perilla frutescens var. hirtella]|nr:pleiotropic drug resistance 12 [Perilla frutescens var. hirtella]